MGASHGKLLHDKAHAIVQGCSQGFVSTDQAFDRVDACQELAWWAVLQAASHGDFIWDSGSITIDDGTRLDSLRVTPPRTPSNMWSMHDIITSKVINLLQSKNASGSAGCSDWPIVFDSKMSASLALFFVVCAIDCKDARALWSPRDAGFLDHIRKCPLLAPRIAP